MNQHLLALSLAAVAVFHSGVSTAQDSYPNRPIRIIVPQAAGSGGDLLARLMAEKVGPRIGQSIVVENRPGANGVLAANFVKADTSAGYTLLLTGVSVLSFNQSLYRQLPYRPLEDFAYIAPVADTAFIFVASKASGIASFKDFLDRAKRRDGAVNYASAGVGNSSHLAAEMIAARTGTKLTHVPYKGSTPILMALQTGEVEVTVGIPNSAGPLIRDGRAVGLAVMGDQRLSELPNVPTFKELGFPVPAMPGWYALVGPANMKPEHVAKLNQQVQDFLNDPETKSKLASMALTPIPGTAQQIRARAAADAEVWGDLIRMTKIELE